MIRALFLLLLFALPACAQKNMYEAKVANGGGSPSGSLLWQWSDPKSCVDGPIEIDQPDGPGKFVMGRDGFICILGAWGRLHLGSFGTGIFVYNDEGYVWPYSSWITTSPGVRDFANGVH